MDSRLFIKLIYIINEVCYLALKTLGPCTLHEFLISLFKSG